MIYCMSIIAKTKTNHRLNFSVCPLYSTIFIFTKHTLRFRLKIYYEHFPLAIQILLAYFMIIYVLYYFISKCAVIFLANFLLLVFSVILFSFIFFKKNKFCYQNLYVVQTTSLGYNPAKEITGKRVCIFLILLKKFHQVFPRSTVKFTL